MANYTDFDEIKNIAAEPMIAYRNEVSLNVILGGKSSGFQEASNSFDVQMIALTRQGIKKSSLKSLASFLGLTMENLSSLLNSSYRNIQRLDDNDTLDKLKSEKVLELASFVQRGISVIGNKDAFIKWLHAPLIALNHHMPVDYLDTVFGINILNKILGRIEYGVYS